MNTNTEPTVGSKPADVYFFGTCLLDIFMPEAGMDAITLIEQQGIRVHFQLRSEERRVGKECRSRWSPYH